jgi:nitrite reductase/ring-hydroxylating ferredoxin subunit
MSRVRLCALTEIPEGDSTGFLIAEGGIRHDLIAVRQDRQVFIYRNSCPHIGAPLDFAPGRFLNPDKTHILCSTHGALFRIADGFCVTGPCLGDSLEAVMASVEDDAVFVDL